MPDDANSSPLDRPARTSGLRQLVRAGIVDRHRLAELRAQLLPAEFWLGLVRNVLLWLGTLLVLAGVVYLFAFNWQQLGRFTKLGSVAGAIVGCLVAAELRGRASTPGKLLVFAAAVLVGVFLAVFGQIYQTGADAWELFAGWALLILPWVAVTGLAALWVLWLVLVSAAALLFWDQVLRPEHAVAMELPHLLPALLGCAMLAARERGAQRGVDWLRETWVRYALLAVVLYLVTVPTLEWIFAYGSSGRSTVGAPAAWLIVTAGMTATWRRLVPDIVALTLVALDVCFVLVCWLADQIEFDNAPFAVAAGALVLFTTAGALLRQADRAMRRAQEAQR